MTEAQFNKLSRPELNALATDEFELDAEQFGNKDEVKEAILEAGIEFDEPAPEEDKESVAPSAPVANELPGHPVRFDESGNPVYGSK